MLTYGRIWKPACGPPGCGLASSHPYSLAWHLQLCREFQGLQAKGLGFAHTAQTAQEGDQLL